MGNSWGNAAIDGLNLGSSAGGLTRSVLKPDSFKIFRNIRSDYEPAFRQSTQVGLGAEAFSSGMGLYGGIEKQIQVSGAQNE